jgi:tricorn protease
MRRCLLFVLLFACPTLLIAEAPRGYYRFPAIHDDAIVFVAEGDLWKVESSGGTARRLTSHPGAETRPAISPDGNTVAFNASYEGPSEIYTMPSGGGLPTRRTFDGERSSVVGWTPNGQLLYSTRKYATLPDAQLVTLDLSTSVVSRIPLGRAAGGSYDASGETLAFTRFSKQSSNTKRYRGGTAEDIWRFSEGDTEAVPLTPDFTGTSREPMWWNSRIYFASDRDGTINIWSMREDGSDLKQHTRHSGWDVLQPDLSAGRIVYQLGADLRLYDIGKDDDREIPITLASDFDQLRERWITQPATYLTSAHLTDDGDRIVLTARGEVFVAPVKHGRFVELTRNAGVRYRQAIPLPGGTSALALSDESGEVEWWKLALDGLSGPEQITDDGRVLRMNGTSSPDGKWLAHTDHDQQLWLTNLESKTSEKIDFSEVWGYDGPRWSADSAWMIYAKPAANTLFQIWLHNVNDGRHFSVTSDRFDSYSGTFSPDGKWIYFLSDRHFSSLVSSPWGSRQPEPFFDRQTKVYMIALNEGQRSPFRPADELDQSSEDDEESDKDETGDPKKKKKDKKKDDEAEDTKQAVEPISITAEGIQQRLFDVPIPRGNLADLSVNKKKLFWTDRETSGERKRSLHALKIDAEEPEPKTLIKDFRTYELSPDGEKLLIRKGNALYVTDASDSKVDLDDSKVDLGAWQFSLDPREEFRQMFIESWRLERDYFYDPGMHGVDWKGMLEKYLPLVERVTNRAELSDLQAQLAGELSTLHTFVYGGDHREGQDDINTASLGGVLERDVAADGYRVTHIYRNDPDYPDSLSPLARPGVGIAEGDIILSVDGVSTLSVNSMGALLRNKAGRQVRLSIQPAGEETERDVIVEPLGSGAARNLRYDEWEYTRRLAVDKAADGQIGYLHLRAMGGSNIAEWQRHFYPVFNRQGLILDVRHNRGGNIDSWILEKLMRPAWFYWQPRIGSPSTNMQYAFRGHMVVLMDENTASDGEAFALGFKELGLGKLIGTRTWGGEVWLTSSNRLVDSGIMTAAEFGVYGPEGEWLIEGHGVDPDIEVDNLPHATFDGADAQLEAAIKHLQELIEQDPRLIPEAPHYPNKSAP